MAITIINDCKSENDAGRQESRLQSLFNSPTSFVGVSSDFSVNATLEAAGNLIDILDANEDREGILLVNVAPRGDIGNDGHNGTPFCYFRYKNTLIISTVKGNTLSLVRKLKLVTEVNLVSVEEVIDYAIENKLIQKEVGQYITTTQFRSYDFVPRLGRWIVDGHNVPARKMLIDEVDEVDNCIWLIDAFGNAKTTLLRHDIAFEPGKTLNTSVGQLTCYSRLKDIPKAKTGMYLGSSGIDERRFLEIATQKTAGSAAKSLGLRVGQTIRIES